jgi:ABC-type multidrug transport system ATPase subunit
MTPPLPVTRSRPAHGDAFVQLEKVTLTYGRGDHRVHALDETDLAIDKGDFVALVGPSGCGKSTILKLVTGLMPATSGYVFVAGREVGAEHPFGAQCRGFVDILPERYDRATLEDAIVAVPRAEGALRRLAS